MVDGVVVSGLTLSDGEGSEDPAINLQMAENQKLDDIKAHGSSVPLDAASDLAWRRGGPRREFRVAAGLTIVQQEAQCEVLLEHLGLDEDRGEPPVEHDSFWWADLVSYPVAEAALCEPMDLGGDHGSCADGALPDDVLFDLQLEFQGRGDEGCLSFAEERLSPDEEWAGGGEEEMVLDHHHACLSGLAPSDGVGTEDPAIDLQMAENQKLGDMKAHGSSVHMDAAPGVAGRRGGPRREFRVAAGLMLVEPKLGMIVVDARQDFPALPPGATGSPEYMYAVVAKSLERGGQRREFREAAGAMILMIMIMIAKQGRRRGGPRREFRVAADPKSVKLEIGDIMVHIGLGQSQEHEHDGLKDYDTSVPMNAAMGERCGDLLLHDDTGQVVNLLSAGLQVALLELPGKDTLALPPEGGHEPFAEEFVHDGRKGYDTLVPMNDAKVEALRWAEVAQLVLPALSPRALSLVVENQVDDTGTHGSSEPLDAASVETRRRCGPRRDFRVADGSKIVKLELGDIMMHNGMGRTPDVPNAGLLVAISDWSGKDIPALPPECGHEAIIVDIPALPPGALRWVNKHQELDDMRAHGSPVSKDDAMIEARWRGGPRREFRAAAGTTIVQLKLGDMLAHNSMGQSLDTPITGLLVAISALPGRDIPALPPEGLKVPHDLDSADLDGAPDAASVETWRRGGPRREFRVADGLKIVKQELGDSIAHNGMERSPDVPTTGLLVAISGPSGLDIPPLPPEGGHEAIVEDIPALPSGALRWMNKHQKLDDMKAHGSSVSKDAAMIEARRRDGPRRELRVAAGLTFVKQELGHTTEHNGMGQSSDLPNSGQLKDSPDLAGKDIPALPPEGDQEPFTEDILARPPGALSLVGANQKLDDRKAYGSSVPMGNALVVARRRGGPRREFRVAAGTTIVQQKLGDMMAHNGMGQTSDMPTTGPLVVISALAGKDIPALPPDGLQLGKRHCEVPHCSALSLGGLAVFVLVLASASSMYKVVGSSGSLLAALWHTFAQQRQQPMRGLVVGSSFCMSLMDLLHAFLVACACPVAWMACAGNQPRATFVALSRTSLGLLARQRQRRQLSLLRGCGPSLRAGCCRQLQQLRWSLGAVGPLDGGGRRF